MIDQRLSQKEKEANNKEWYKRKADYIDRQHYHFAYRDNKSIEANYNLFNNILDVSDFEYVCKPFGSEVGELPAQMVNRDIVSGKIKSLMGMEMKRPFSWKVIAVNPEATTQKEKVEFNLIRDYVISRLQEKDPEMSVSEIKRYMQREYQDPAEVLSHQLLEYLIQKCSVKRKFNEAFKHLALSAKEVLYVGIVNGEPEVWNVNSMRFNCELSPDNQFIEDAEWASCEYLMTPSEAIKFFGKELTDEDIDKIYNNNSKGEYLDFFGKQTATENYVRVLHCVWKSLRKIKFLTYLDEDGQEQLKVVDEEYKLNKESGDVHIEEEWLPEVYQTWKIGRDIYVEMFPLAGQFKDLDNLYKCKLPYYGAICDNTNSTPTSIMDRLKVYQYYYNIVMYRIELLLASDKGKKVLMNINSIPDSAGIDIEKWQYFFESSPFMWFDPNEEGTGYTDMNSIARQIDLSLSSDIAKYIQFAEYLKRQASMSIGILDETEFGANNKEQISPNVIEPYFDLHDHVKRNVLEALIETAKIAYATSKPQKLTYVLDDLSSVLINSDVSLLENATLGIFLSNSSRISEVKALIEQLAHAAMQNQRVELSDVISVLKQESIAEAEEVLKTAEENKREAEAKGVQEQQEATAKLQEMSFELERQRHEQKLTEITVKETERRKTEAMKKSIQPEEEKDIDITKIVRAELNKEKLNLEKEKLEHQKLVDKQRLVQSEKRLEKV